MSRRMSLSKTSGESPFRVGSANFSRRNSIFSKKVTYIIPKSVIQKYNQIVETLGKEYEEKNFKPNVSYKLSGTAYINKKLEIHVKDGKPGEICFNSQHLGDCLDSSTTRKDVEILLRKYDPSIDEPDKLSNYVVKTSLLTEGFITGRTWEIFDLQGNLIKDLTDYDNWKSDNQSA